MTRQTLADIFYPVIRRKSRDIEGIGSLKALSALDPFAVIKGAAEGAHDVDELIGKLGTGARASLDNPSRLHGLRAEAMFRAVLVALGRFQLLVEDDEGQVYFEDSHGPVKLPDYRAVDAGGDQVLVEVKAVSPKPLRLSHSIPASEFEGLQRYGELTGAPISMAHYWSSANLWTLVDLDHLRSSKNRYEIDIGTAMKFNQMSRFGDRIIATEPPLELRLEVEERGQRSDGNVTTITIDDVQLLAAGKPITDEVERQIAFSLFRFGKWDYEIPAELDTDGRVRSISVTAAPPDEESELIEKQGFAMIGTLSSMYSALFNEATLDDSGAVQRLDHYSEPGEFGSLIPPDYFQRPDRRLPIWIFEQQPAED